MIGEHGEIYLGYHTQLIYTSETRKKSIPTFLFSKSKIGIDLKNNINMIY